MPRAVLALVVGTLVLLAGAPLPAHAQCLLANPSFELRGSGQVFGGWNQFGDVGSTSIADHGALAARISGQPTGSWELAAYWQPMDCVPGEQWKATGRVQHPSGSPLVGQNAALVNIEWRDAAGLLIDYDSFPVADAGSPSDEYLDFSVLSSPAPSGTASTRILVGVLQSPSDPSSDAYFDQITFTSTTPPTVDDVQWNDFPSGITVDFAGYTWRVKGPGIYGPGSNRFCPTSDCVWVDTQQRLHMTLQNIGGLWYSTEAVVEDALGYGDYILTTQGRLDLLDPEAVLGIFLWQYDICWDPSYVWWNPYNEIDIEYSRWGNPSDEIGQFVAQPWDFPGNIERYDASFSDGELTSHAIRWLADRVEYRAWRGDADEESAGNLLHSWTYTGPHIPRPEQPRMHLNLWKLSGTPASNQEVVFTDFRFVPAGGATPVEELADRLPRRAPAELYPAVPNPFNPRTSIRFELHRDGPVRVEIYDLGGRHVRTLVEGSRAAGSHETTWWGRDDAGRTVASGVYVVRLSGVDFVQTQRVSLIK